MKIILLILCSMLLFGCSEDEAVDPRKKYKYSVFLRVVGGSQTLYVGSTVGLGSCAIVGRRAMKERLSYELAGKGWGIVCCWRTASSQCKEEHRYKDHSMPYEEWKNNPESHIAPRRKHFFKTKK